MKLAWLAGAAAAAVVAVAVVDAVRREDEPEPPPPTTELESRDELAAALAELGARGELLLYGSGCSVERLVLPSLVLHPMHVCWPLGTRSPSGEVVAVCQDRATEVYSREGVFQNSHLGCTPAWQPGRTLTLSRDGAIVTPDGTVLIPTSELQRAARLHPAIPDRTGRVLAIVDGVAWISDTKAAVAISPRLRSADFGPIGLIAFFENGRLLPTTQPQFRVPGGPLAPSPRGTYVTQTADLIMRADGSLLGLPDELRDARALAWSPDERFLALAFDFAVVIVPVASLEQYDRDSGGLRTVTIPQPALELDWR